jgi:hypothetical protein
MKELVELIARALVDRPDQVAVAELPGNDTIVYQLRVAPEDLGKVIGKQGRTARAVRTLVQAAGAKRQKQVVLEIVE